MAAVAAVGLLVSCKAALPPVPGNGGPAWIELRSPHFTVWTDGDPERVQELMRAMERMREIVVRNALPGAPDRGRNLAIVMRDGDELSSFSSTGQPRAFTISARFPLWQTMIVLALPRHRSADNRYNVTVAHELTHAISFGVVHHQPRWFAEGMATYFETVGLDPTLATAELGVSPTGRLVSVAHLLPISTLFAWTARAKDERREYTTAWALFWFLINQHSAELLHYRELLDRAGDDIEVPPERATRIWLEAFPSLPLDEVDGKLKHWLLNGMHREDVFKLAASDWEPVQRTMGDAEVHALRALLHKAGGKQDAQVRDSVTAALAVDPTNVLARLLALALDHKEIAADEARAIAREHDGDWRAWMLIAMAVQKANGSTSEIKAAHARACALAGANPALLVPSELCPAEAARR
jgi:hypothetical protein